MTDELKSKVVELRRSADTSVDETLEYLKTMRETDGLERVAVVGVNGKGEVIHGFSSQTVEQALFLANWLTDALKADFRADDLYP